MFVIPDMFVIPACLPVRQLFVIPTEAEESCNFLILLKFLGVSSLGNCSMRCSTSSIWLPGMAGMQ